jgi:hypothetical protein
MSMGRKSCHYGQHSMEGHECPLADRAVVGSSVQKKEGHKSVHRREELPLRATLKGRTRMSILR